MWQLGELAGVAIVGRCRKRAAALLQVSCVSVVQVSCNKVGEMRYGLHGTSNDRARSRMPRAAPRKRAAPPLGRSPSTVPVPSSRLRLTYPCKLLRLSTLPITMHNVRHMEWGFYSVEPAKGGEGGPTWIYDGDDDASPPSDFFSPTGPLRACPSRSPCSTLFAAACVHVVPLGAIDVFLWGDVSSGQPG